MGSDRRNGDRDFNEAIGIGIGALGVVWFALHVYPQSLAAFVGAVVAGAHPWRFDDRGGRRSWRAVAGWSIAAGLALLAAYLLVDSTIGADTELRRFQRQWRAGHLFAGALIAHPWGWVPLASAAALAAFGGAILWRAR